MKLKNLVCERTRLKRVSKEFSLNTTCLRSPQSFIVETPYAIMQTMKEITEITFDKRSKEFNIHLYDENDGWQDVRCGDVDTLIEKARDYLDRVDVDTLGPEEATAIRESSKGHEILIPEDLSKELERKISKKTSGDLEQKDGLDDIGRWRDTKVFYVTDIHLDSKISDIYGDSVSDEDAEFMIGLSVENIVKDYREGHAHHSILLIGGDVSHDCHRTEVFYRKLTESIPEREILAILGNHEYWDEKTREFNTSDLNLTSEFYEKMFNRLYVSFADNMLFTYKGNRRYFVRGEKLLNASLEDIREFVKDSPLTILGGTGFSGLNEEYNCTCGMYRDAVRSREQEKELSARFESVYSKVLEAVPDSRVLVLTHMPMCDWTSKKPNPNWIYVSGHTHRNILNVSDESRIYSDNQIGYGGVVHLKSFYMSREHDIFRYYSDGIHTITKELYQDFYRSKNMSMSCNREGTYTMIKRDSLYCFFYQKGGKLYMLDGGVIRDASGHDLEYYFDNMTKYGEAVSGFVKEYQDRLRTISSMVKAIGGNGRMHGCIVDVDFFNHVYLNPFDGTVTSYTATDVVNKYVFPGFEAMLESQRKDLLPEYRKMLDQEETNLPATLTKKTGSEGYYGGTDIYRVSRLFYTMQHLTENFVIRRWDDALMSATDKNRQRASVLSLLSGETGGQ